MIKKLSQIQFTRYDFVIIGPGPARMATALELEKNKKTILILEGGDFKYSKESQSLYNGQTIGNKNFNTNLSRVGYFSGSGNHRGGMCRLFSKSEACELLQISRQFKKDKKINNDFERIAW